MKTSQLFARELQVKTAGLDAPAVNARLARTALDALEQAIANGEGSRAFVRSVNGIIGAAEASVQAPGPIVYRFVWLEAAVRMALGYCEGRSPVHSGLYRRSWFAMVNGSVWREGTPIPADAEAIVTNDRPYHRKIEVGAMQMSLPPFIVEGARSFIRSEFRGAVRAEVSYIELKGGYRLKRDGGRKGRRRGEPLTYPALVLTVA